MQKPTPSLAQATALYQVGRYAEAEVEARAAAEARSCPRREAPLARHLAAAAMSAQGRHAEALCEYDALLLVFRSIFGADHPRTLVLRSDRAQTLAALSRYAECETECAAVARTAARRVGRTVPSIAAAAHNGLIYALNGQGRHQEAETLARAALRGPTGPSRLDLVLRLGLARSLNGQGRHEEALAEAERAAALRSHLPEGQQHPETGAVELAIASALLGLGRGTEARARTATAHDACLTAFGPDHHRTAEALALIERIDGA